MRKKIAILGGGLTGLVAAYYLSKKDYQITLYEKETVLGGLAAGFKKKAWQWFLEKTVHHLFVNDWEIRSLAAEVGYNKIFFKSPLTASFDNYRIFPVDSPQDLLNLPGLSFVNKIRSGLVLSFLKLSPFLPVYEKETSEVFLKKYMGEEGWKKLFESLFRKKFGKYAKNILASFIWARIKKRTRKLGYFEGGFQAFINFLQEICEKSAVIIRKETTVEEVGKRKGKILVNGDEFDMVISTLPTPMILKICRKIFPKNYLQQLQKIKYLHALSLILETKKPVIEKVYWLNILDEKLPLMGVFSQTNFVDKKYYNNHHITYIGWYVDESDKKWVMEKEELLNWVIPYLNQVGSIKREDIIDSFLFKAKYAQPIFDKEFLKNKPDFQTPSKNLYIANLDMTYPYDRGTNYAVKLGKEVIERMNL